MIPNNEEKIYEILSKLIGLKFKSQIKDSGIVFKKIYRIIDLYTNEEYYSLIINNEQINFKNTSEFVKKFISHLENNINEFEKRFEELQKKSKDKWIDENQIFIENEEIGHHNSKQFNLLKKMNKFKNTNL